MGNKVTLTTRAWGLLRLALLWARKGRAFRRVLSGSNFLKGLRIGGGSHFNDGYQIRHGDREISFGETPVFRLGGRSSRRASGSIRLILSRIPCVNAPPPANLEFADDEHATISEDAFFSRSYSEIEDDEGEEQEFVFTERVEVAQEMTTAEEDNEVDPRAEEFIAKFYTQMKLQRQVSLLQYHEMLNRGS